MDIKRNYYYENQYKSNLFSREKTRYGQKKSQQNRIKNIFKTMKKQDIEVKQEYAKKDLMILLIQISLIRSRWTLSRIRFTSQRFNNL